MVSSSQIRPAVQMNEVRPEVARPAMASAANVRIPLGRRAVPMPSTLRPEQRKKKKGDKGSNKMDPGVPSPGAAGASCAAFASLVDRQRCIKAAAMPACCCYCSVHSAVEAAPVV